MLTNEFIEFLIVLLKVTIKGYMSILFILIIYSFYIWYKDIDNRKEYLKK